MERGSSAGGNVRFFLQKRARLTDILGTDPILESVYCATRHNFATAWKGESQSLFRFILQSGKYAGSMAVREVSS
jgi:hypothetical protein